MPEAADGGVLAAAGSDPVVSPSRPPLRAVGFGLLLVCFVLVRGLNLSAVLMPFEGWDEYAHLAVAAHIDQHGEMPTLQDTVPSQMWQFLRAHPHPPPSRAENAGLGVQDYVAWEREPLAPLTDPRPPRLYEVQQGPLYYQALVLLKRVCRLTSYEAWSDAGRAANVLCAALTCLLWFVIVHHQLPQPEGAALAGFVGVASAANSLMLYNAARIANDALALFLGTLAVAFYYVLVRPTLHYPLRRGAWRVLLLGVIVGLSVATKLHVLPVLPVLALGLAVHGYRDSRRWSAVGALCALYGLGYVVGAGWFHAQMYQLYGSPLGMLGFAHDPTSVPGWLDLMHTGPRVRIEVLPQALVWSALHASGWSDAAMPVSPHLLAAFRTLTLIGVLCLLLAIYNAKRRERVMEYLGRVWEIPVLVLTVWAALTYRVLLTRVVWQDERLHARHALLAFPALLCVVLFGPAVFSRRALTALGTALVVLFALAYYVGAYGDHLVWQTGDLYGGVLHAAREVQAHHALFTWPMDVALWIEGGLLTALLLTVGAPLLRRT